MLMTDKNKQKLKQINYMNCEHEGHEGEPLSRVCIDRECKMKTLICGMCEEEKHQSHQTMPLKNFLQKFCMGQSEKNNKNKQNMSSLYYAHKLDEVRSSFFDSIQHFKMQINQALAQLESQAKIYFNEVSERLRIFVGIENPIEYFSKQGASQSRIKKYLEQLLENFKVKQKFSLAGKLQQLVNRGYEKEKMLTTSLSKIKTESLAFMGKLKKGLQPESLNKIERVLFAWSQELKGTKMKINGNIAQQTGMESSGQRFIMLEPSLTDGLFYEDKICWGIKVIKFVGWIGVGICLKNVITKANFFFNYTTVGHGSYMISNNGYSWSHSLLQFNSAHKTFHYAQNDIVYIEYDKKAKKLRFTKNKGPQKFELDIADPPSGDSYYPCANICSTGDAIQVINQVGESS